MSVNNRRPSRASDADRPASWTVPPDRPAAISGEVHLWLADAEALGPAAHLARLLDAGERARAERFRFDRDRRLFTLFRGAMRLILSRYVGVAPEELRFAYSPFGKPSLTAPPSSGDLEFNLAHSEGVALLAVGRGRGIGVDLERIRAERSAEGIAETFFSREEIRSLDALPPDRRRQAFFACWTRKEAYLKARGDGLSVPLASFSVSVGPEEPAILRSSDLGEPETSRWFLADVDTAPGYAAAIAVEGGGWLLRRWRFSLGGAGRG